MTITTDEDLKAAFRRLDAIFQTAEKTPEAAERDVLVGRIKEYEARHYDFGPPDPSTPGG